MSKLEMLNKLLKLSESRRMNHGSEHKEFSKRPPMLLRTIGTSGATCARYARKEFIETFGDEPEHVSILSVDTAAQQQHDLVDMLPDKSVIDLSAQDQLQDRIRRAWEDSRNREWMPKVVTNLGVGRGAGGLEAGARFLLQQNLPETTKKILKVLDQYTTANRAALAERANRHPLLRCQQIAVTTSGPIDLHYFAATTGGTSGVLLNDVSHQRYLLREKGLEANTSLFLTLPAVGLADEVENRRKLQKLYGRLQELADLNAGKRFVWKVGDLVFEETGLPFEAIYLLPEPTPGKLDEHHRWVGRLALVLASPLGKALTDQAVNQLDLFRQKGPLGQPKMFSLLGMAELKPAAYADVTGYVRARLGTLALGVPTVEIDAVAVELLKKNGLNAEAWLTPRLSLKTHSVPADLDDPDSFLNHLDGALQVEASKKAKEQANSTAEAIDQFKELLNKAVASQCHKYGPAAAARITLKLSQELNGLQTTVTGTRTKFASFRAAATGSSPESRLQALLKTHLVHAQGQYLDLCLPHIAGLITDVDRLHTRYQGAAEVLAALQLEYEQHKQGFTSIRPAPYAVLDVPFLNQLVRDAAPTCAQELRRRVQQALDNQTAPEQLQIAIQTIIAEHAKPFARFENVEEALRAAEARGSLALQNVIAAAEPSVRLDSNWDRRTHSARFAFVNVPEEHPAADLLRRQGRTVCSSSSWTSGKEITILTVDFGIEVGALTASRDALHAHVHSPSETPPHGDKNYAAFTDLVPPAAHEWFAHLTIPIHLYLRTGVISFRPPRGFLYGDKSVGKNLVEASEVLLRRSDRAAFLPEWEEMCAQTEESLLRVGDTEKIIAVLTEIEERLTRQLDSATPAKKQVLYYQRAAARSVRAQYQEQINEAAAHADAWEREHPQFHSRLHGNDLIKESANGTSK